MRLQNSGASTNRLHLKSAFLYSNYCFGGDFLYLGNLICPVRVRFTQEQFDYLLSLAEAWQCSPSYVIRSLVNDHKIKNKSHLEALNNDSEAHINHFVQQS